MKNNTIIKNEACQKIQVLKIQIETSTKNTEYQKYKS